MNIANKSHALGSSLGFHCPVLNNFQGNKEHGLCFFMFCLYSICWAMDRKLIPNFSWQCYFIFHPFSLFCRQFFLLRYCASPVGSPCVTTAKSYHTVNKGIVLGTIPKRYLFCLQRIGPDDTPTHILSVITAAKFDKNWIPCDNILLFFLLTFFLLFLFQIA